MLSTTAANNSLVATLLKTSTKTSSAFANSVWQTNSASRVSVCLCTFSRTAYTAATRHKTKAPSPPTASYFLRLQPTTPSASIPFPTTSASCRTSSARSCARTTTKPSSKTKTCRRNSAFPSPVCRPPARSPRLASGRSGAAASGEEEAQARRGFETRGADRQAQVADAGGEGEWQ